MNREHFLYIKYFTADEITATGASLEDVSYLTIHNLDRVRSVFGKPIRLCKNGLTSGNHSSELHKQGLAVDFYIEGIKPHEVPKLCLIGASKGFLGMGVYHNGKEYSFHFDMRNYISTWYGTKNEQGGWKYSALEFKE